MNRHQRRAIAARSRNSGSLGHRIKREVDRLVARIDRVEYLDALEEENALLRARVEKFERELVPLSQFAATVPKLQVLQEELSRLRFQSAVTKEERIDIPELPRDLVGVMDLIEVLYGDRIIFAPEARRSAASAAFQDPAVGWRVLRAMATTLYDLYQDRVPNIEREFRDRTGLEIALGETSETRKDRELRRLRTMEMAGRTFDISPHVKFGVREPRLLRVHYAVHRGVILVGHCGDHLETAGTRRMR